MSRSDPSPVERIAQLLKRLGLQMSSASCNLKKRGRGVQQSEMLCFTFFCGSPRVMFREKAPSITKHEIIRHRQSQASIQPRVHLQANITLLPHHLSGLIPSVTEHSGESQKQDHLSCCLFQRLPIFPKLLSDFMPPTITTHPYRWVIRQHGYDSRTSPPSFPSKTPISLQPDNSFLSKRTST